MNKIAHPEIRGHHIRIKVRMAIRITPRQDAVITRWNRSHDERSETVRRHHDESRGGKISLSLSRHQNKRRAAAEELSMNVDESPTDFAARRIHHNLQSL